ncbi:MAG: AI-2E family transporter [Verrucomicrobia bacterium]|nr:AI-2E family transporter [Verrucomicrobiota bacterium]
MPFPPPTEKQARILWASLTTLAVAVLIGLVGLLCWGLGWVINRLSSVLLPLAIAGILAYLLDPLVDGLERRGQPRARAILCVFALALVLVAAVLGSVLPHVISETRQLAERIPGYVERTQQRVEDWISNPPAPLQKWLPLRPLVPGGTNAPARSDAPPAPATTNETSAASAPADQLPAWLTALDPRTLKSATGWLANVLPKVGSWLLGQATKVASWFGVLAGLALIPVYAFYFLLEKRGISRNWTDYLPVADSAFKDELVFVLRSINDCLIAFFRGQVLVAISDGVCYTIGFFLIGLPYAFLLGAVATVLTMIPFLGAITTCVAALLIALVQFGDWLHPLLVLAVFGVVQTLEGLVISPKIMGDRVGLHPLTIIIALMVGTTMLGGILGGILAIPLTAALRTLMFRYVWRQGEGRGVIVRG